MKAGDTVYRPYVYFDGQNAKATVHVSSGTIVASSEDHPSLVRVGANNFVSLGDGWKATREEATAAAAEELADRIDGLKAQLADLRQ